MTGLYASKKACLGSFVVLPLGPFTTLSSSSFRGEARGQPRSPRRPAGRCLALPVRTPGTGLLATIPPR